MLVEALIELYVISVQERGVGESALRGRSRPARVPEWVEKWAALIMEYVEREQALLPEELLALRPPYATYTPASAAAEAKGVSDNRLQNVVITLDKVKLCLERPGELSKLMGHLCTDACCLDCLQGLAAFTHSSVHHVLKHEGAN